MLIYKSRFLLRGEVWYEHTPNSRSVDWILYRQRASPIPGTRWRYFHTLIIDLGQTPEALLDQMNKSTASKVKRARDRDRITCERINPDTAGIVRFVTVYNQFAATKGLDPLDRSELEGLAAERLLELSVAKNRAGEPLVFHAYYRDSDCSCFLYSASLHRTFSDSAVRNAIGRANVFLFWDSLLRHKVDGLKCFDFGGWYPGSTDQQLLGINRFKAGFGGKLICKYTCEQILSVKGWVLLTTARMLSRVRGSDSTPVNAELANPVRPACQDHAIPVAVRGSPNKELEIFTVSQVHVNHSAVQAPSGYDVG